MRVAFDQQIFENQVYGGISRYFSRLIENLAVYEDIEAKIFCPIYRNHYLSTLSKKLVSGMHVPDIPKTNRLRLITNSIVTPVMIKKFQPDVVHETYYSDRPVNGLSSPRVITVYDMIHEKMPHLYSNNPISKIKRKAIERADHVICISENTRNDLIEFFNIPSEEISVIYLGFDHIFSDSFGTSNIGLNLKKEKPYILYVGSRRTYKNFPALVNAYSSSLWLRNNFNIICFGGEKYSVMDDEIIRKNKLTSEQVVYVSGEDVKLAAYYKNASVFVYPSLYEGFGIPPLEAMSAGCPVICSNTSSIPEVVGDAGEYFDPLSMNSIKTAIEKILSSDEKRLKLIKNGYKQCKQFSWARCAQETLEVYRGLV